MVIGGAVRLFCYILVLGSNIAACFGQPCDDFGLRNYAPYKGNHKDGDWRFTYFNENVDDCYLCAQWEISSRRQAFTLIYPCLQEEVLLTGGRISVDFFHINVPDGKISPGWKILDNATCQADYDSAFSVPGSPTGNNNSEVIVDAMSFLQIQPNTSRSLGIQMEMNKRSGQPFIVCIESITFLPNGEGNTSTIGDITASVTSPKTSTAELVHDVDNVTYEDASPSGDMTEAVTEMEISERDTERDTSDVFPAILMIVGITCLIGVVIGIAIVYKVCVLNRRKRNEKTPQRHPDISHNQVFDGKVQDEYDKVNEQTSNAVYSEASVTTSMDSSKNEYARSIDMTLASTTNSQVSKLSNLTDDGAYEYACTTDSNSYENLKKKRDSDK